MHRIRSSQRDPATGSWNPALSAFSNSSTSTSDQSSNPELRQDSRGDKQDKKNKGFKTLVIRILHNLARLHNLVYGLVLILASLLVLSSWQYFSTAGDINNNSYTVYIDGGSSGTRIHVFEFRLARWPSYVKLHLPEISFAVEPGLSHYADKPDEAADSFAKLLEFAYTNVPEAQWHITPVHLLATAGLRMLSEDQVEVILQSCRSKLASSRFLFRNDWARVIGGDLEGLYGWAAVNYVSGALEEAAFHYHHSRKEILDPAMFSGVLEMGGASMQITFLPLPPDETTERVGTRVALPGVPSHLFTHSYLGLGMDSALERAADLVLSRYHETERKFDPCLPIGYEAEDGRHGNATFLDCLKIAHSVIPLCQPPAVAFAPPSADASDTSFVTKAEVQRASGRDRKSLQENDTAQAFDHRHGSHHNRSSSIRNHGGIRGMKSDKKAQSTNDCHSVDGVQLPPLTGSFVAMENFYWTAKALGLTNRPTLQELHDAGDRYCSRHWSSLHAEFSGHIPDQFLMRYCFAAAYIFTLLHQGFGIGLDERLLTYTNTIKDARSGSDVSLSWVVGAMLVDAMDVERQSTFHFLSRGGEHTPGKYLGLAVPIMGLMGGTALIVLHCFSRMMLKTSLKHSMHQLLHDSSSSDFGGSISCSTGSVAHLPSTATFILIPSSSSFGPLEISK